MMNSGFICCASLWPAAACKMLDAPFSLSGRPTIHLSFAVMMVRSDSQFFPGVTENQLSKSHKKASRAACSQELQFYLRLLIQKSWCYFSICFQMKGFLRQIKKITCHWGIDRADARFLLFHLADLRVISQHLL